MKPISHVKLFRGGRLPDWDVPIVIIAFEQTRDDFFFAEYFILYQKSQRLDSCRLSSPKSAESVKEYLEFRTPEGIMQDMADAAQVEIEGDLVESLSREQQHQWILGPAYTLAPIEFEELRTLWIRGRVEQPIRDMARMTRSVELKHDLDQIFALPHLKFNEEKPIPPPR